MSDEIQNLDSENAQPEDAQLDAMIQFHLKNAIDPYVGSAAARFAQRVEESRERRFRILPAWSIGLVGAALAATLAIVSMRHVTPPSTMPRMQPAPVEQATLTGTADLSFHTVDKGIVELPDGSLARKYYQTRLDTLTVVDPKTNRETIYQQPRQETILVGLKKY